MKKEIYKNECYIINDKKPDALFYVTKSSTKEQRRKFDIGDIFINAAVCRGCGDYIRSQHRHDYVMCECGKTVVDGGSWYAKRAGEEKDRIDIIEKFIK